MYKVGILTLSDKAAAGEREDLSGLKIKEMLTGEYKVITKKIVPDERILIKGALIEMADILDCDLILTTGGTGFSSRDITPEATMDVCHRNAPGIAEALRAHSMEITQRAMLSRGVSVIRGKTLIINLPGSEKAVEESMEFLMGNIEHGLDILLGRDQECGRKNTGMVDNYRRYRELD